MIGVIDAALSLLGNYACPALSGLLCSCRAGLFRSFSCVRHDRKRDRQAPLSSLLCSPIRCCRVLACVLALAIPLFLPLPARAITVSDIVNQNIADSIFSGLSAGGTNFTNALLYQIYIKIDGIADITDWNYDWLQIISGKMDEIIDNGVTLEDSTLVTNLSNIRNAIERTNSYLSNSAGTVIQAAQGALGHLSDISGLLGGGQPITNRLDGLSNQLGSSGVLASLLSGSSPLATRLDGLSNQLGSSGVLASLLLGDGPVATRVSSVVQLLGSGQPITNRLDGLSTQLGSTGVLASLLLGNGPIATRLNAVVDQLGSSGVLASLLLGNGPIGTRLDGLSNLLGSTGVISGLLGTLIDGLDSNSASIIDRLAQLPGYISSGASSIVDALGNVAITFPDSITATLAPGVSIPAETDVAGEAAQSATLWDTVVGDVDTSQIQSQMESCVGVLRTSFPFGLIFVVIDTLGALSAAPVAPVFEADLPAVAGSYHMVLDLSYFDSVAALFRGGFVVLYCFGLYSATKQWTFNAGGDPV